MGTDTPISALSLKSKSLYTYFKQNFAQVTNPPIDPIREELVMSLVSFIGPRPNSLDLEGNARLKRLEVRQPILTNEDLEKIRCIGHFEDTFDTRTIDITYDVERGPAGMEDALLRVCERAEAAVLGRYNIIILSDRIWADRIPIPALLATAAVHHHLIRKGLRTSVGLVVETGDAREVHHFCCLAGYGAEAINPYLAFETLAAMASDLPGEDQRSRGDQALHQVDRQGAVEGHVQDGHFDLSVLLRRQIFDGLDFEAIVDKFLRHGHDDRRLHLRDHGRNRGPPCRSVRPFARAALLAQVRGDYAYRLRGEAHSWTPETVSFLKRGARQRKEKYDAYAKILNDQAEHLLTSAACSVSRALRTMARARSAGGRRTGRQDRQTFSTGAMSTARSRARRTRRLRSR